MSFWMTIPWKNYNFHFELILMEPPMFWQFYQYDYFIFWHFLIRKNFKYILVSDKDFLQFEVNLDSWSNKKFSFEKKVFNSWPPKIILFDVLWIDNINSYIWWYQKSSLTPVLPNQTIFSKNTFVELWSDCCCLQACWPLFQYWCQFQRCHRWWGYSLFGSWNWTCK